MVSKLLIFVKLFSIIGLFFFSSASNRIIHAKDHASIQIRFVDVDENGRFKSSSAAFAICGALRRMVFSNYHKINNFLFFNII